jgi:hypothetical protein
MENPCNKLSFNALRKNSKNGVFSTEHPFVRSDALYLGSKFEYYLTKQQLQIDAIVLLDLAHDEGTLNRSH